MTLVANRYEFNQVIKLMGNRFEFTAVSESEQLSEKAIEAAIAEVQRIERIFTTYDQTSVTNQINDMAGILPVKVHEEVLQLIKRAIRISVISQGAFDLTFGGVDKSLWNFDQKMKHLPDAELARKSVHLVNYKNIVIDEEAQTVFLLKKGMRIGFGGIGKGYAAMSAKSVMEAMGVTGGVVNAAGDLTVWGSQKDGRKWKLGIANPNFNHKIFSSLEFNNGSVATSGNYEKYVVIGGKRYSHTIDPRTGMPVHGIKSVTIICNNAELADALTTPVMVMGVEAGLFLINQLKGVATIIVDEKDSVHCSNNIQLK